MRAAPRFSRPVSSGIRGDVSSAETRTDGSASVLMLFQLPGVHAVGRCFNPGAAAQEPLRQPDDADAEHAVADQLFSGRRSRRSFALFASRAGLGAPLR